MDRETEVIREHMDETRADLQQKLETLEEKVLGTIESTTNTVEQTVESVKEAVEGTVESVRETVAETVETVKHTFDLPAHVRNHPWLMFGGSLAVGFATGHLLGRFLPQGGRRSSRRRDVPTLSTLAAPPAPSSNGGRHEQTLPRQEPEPAPPARQEPSGGMFGWLGSRFSTELNKLKSLAIGAALGVVRDAVKQTAVPEIGEQLAEMIDGVTTKLGGQVIHGPLFKPSDEQRASETPQSQTHGTSTLRSVAAH
jgi:ElaB/YqjD/DUF883 family membrane-anchored ribosome-binding protein